MKLFSLDNPLLNYQQRVKRLRVFTLLLFLMLFIPASTISYLGFQQLHKDVLVKYQRHTEKITTALSMRLFKNRVNANALPISHFDYYHLVYNPVTENLTQTLSPLYNPDSYQEITGLMGYFQIDLDGNFNSPVWPYELDSEEDNLSNAETLSAQLTSRRELALELKNIVFSSKQMNDLLNQNLASAEDRFEMFDDVPRYYIFYRVVVFNEKAKVQGYVLNRDLYLNSYVELVLNLFPTDVPLSVTLSDPFPLLKNSYFMLTNDEKGDISVIRTTEQAAHLSSQILGEQKLGWPFLGVTITYSTSSLRHSAEGLNNIGLSITLLCAMALSCLGFYRIGVKQLKLAEQRLNFVSSVSHELKTPLTSIRMYAEMLQSGNVISEQHRKDYYDFIFSESERLSRLIENILQLAKLSQPQHNVQPEYLALPVLEDIVRSKVSTMLQSHGFTLNIINEFKTPEQVQFWVDIDAFSQVVINIIDNAIKFFDQDKIQDPERKKIDFSFSRDTQNAERILLEIRDYGLGIQPEEEHKLFELFYRGGNELNRATQGTGIGLALVKELVSAQQGNIRVKRMSPGLALQISLVAQYAQT